MNKHYALYTLTDPSTGHVFYVGYSANPTKAFKILMKGKSLTIGKHLLSMKRKGLTPVQTVVSNVYGPMSHAHDEKTLYITNLVLQGTIPLMSFDERNRVNSLLELENLPLLDQNEQEFDVIDYYDPICCLPSDKA